MDVLIHTYGRADYDLQYTLQALNDSMVPVTLIVQDREKEKYLGWVGAPCIVLPPEITRLAPTRDWIIYDMKSKNDSVVFFDDDLDFAVRRNDDPTKFYNAQPSDIRAMIACLRTALVNYPMAGIGTREGGNRVTDTYLYNTRIMRVLGFQRSYLRRHHMTFTPLEVMEDFHINLQILRSGGDTIVLNNWVSNQRGGSNAAGGCSSYRTEAVQTAAAHKLATLHPGFVKVVQKASKTAWNGQPRTDVIVQWKRARASAS